MKKLLIVTALLLQTLSSFSMETPQQLRHQCSTRCINACQEVKNNHSNLLASLQERLHWKQLWGDACGKPCNIETEYLEILFKEEVPTALVTPKQPIKISTSSPNFHGKQAPLYSDIDSLLNELEKDSPKPKYIKVLLVDHAKELTLLIRRAGSQTLSLLKPESGETDKNNLDATCRQLEERNNALLDIIGTATEAEKNHAEFLRLSALVAQAIESAKRLGAKEPLAAFEDDFTHPFNSYKNEIQLLQHLLTQNK